MFASALPAHAAKRKVPFGFFGTVVPPEMFPVRESTLNKQFALMAWSGVESVRLTFDWASLEPQPGVYVLNDVDKLVRSASRARVQIILNISGTPCWASSAPLDPECRRFPPADSHMPRFAALMELLVRRYGSKGSFWSQNRSVPRNPIVYWQLWNEQTAPWHWRAARWASGYTRLLKLAYPAIKRADRRAKVVAGSLVAHGQSYNPWTAARDLYQAGARKYFDAIAVHPFTNDPKSVSRTAWQTTEILRRVRSVMNGAGDKRKPLLVTEITWPAGKGKVPRQARFYMEVTAKGQAQRMRAAFYRLAAWRKRLRLTHVQWYTWGTGYDSVGPTTVMLFRYSGLTKMRGESFKPLPILKTYAAIAAHFQGCKKRSDARRCR
ncbi:beta-galactosidase [Thermoleophilum album]|uniref:beta-galactosidase n=1 Tax=Thermoleophilum album TaxID=29539 RepID=UPI00237CE06D|nr:beta-galactosidase [Thermoleophilum album]WDT94128.1 beta-galactosidase [Thermoleophilum album]